MFRLEGAVIEGRRTVPLNHWESATATALAFTGEVILTEVAEATSAKARIMIVVLRIVIGGIFHHKPARNNLALHAVLTGSRETRIGPGRGHAIGRLA